jgi:hypothetical protein
MLFQKMLSYFGRPPLPRIIAALTNDLLSIAQLFRVANPKKVPGTSSRVGFRDTHVPCGTTFGFPT